MKQYSTTPTNYTSTTMLKNGTMRMEAYLGGSYSHMARGVRRYINNDPVAWWRNQVMSRGYMPSRYHCGGYGK